MWLFTTRGFYSAVRKPEDRNEDRSKEMLTIRGRSKQHLENLEDLLPEGVKIQTGGGTDYPVRIRMTHDQWDQVVLKLSQEIAYSNFKSAVAAAQGHNAYEHACHGVWSVMTKVERAEPSLI